MILIIGGAFQNKREYAIQTYLDKEDHKRMIIDQVQDIVREKLVIKEYTKTMFDHIIDKNPDTIFICDEVGAGLVPIDSFDREYREKVGEICCHLAEKATTVHRVVCGIGKVIKDD